MKAIAAGIAAVAASFIATTIAAGTVLVAAPAVADTDTSPDPFASVERWNPGLIREPRSGAKGNDMGPRKKVVLGVHTVRQVGDPSFGPKPMRPRP